MAQQSSEPTPAENPGRSSIPLVESDRGLPLSEARRRWATWRSMSLGTIGVILVCGLTPFNDYVVANTFLVGSYLPVVVVATLFFLAVLLNAPLHRWLPRHALGSGELGVILGMMLVACALPSQGLMRGFLPTLVSPFHFGATMPAFRGLFLEMDLPGWLFPVDDLAEGHRSAVVTWFYSRAQADSAIPYGEWIVPIGGWGVFLFAMFAMLIALAILVRSQWADNERLPFPLVQLQLALIEPPARGRVLNETLGSRPFWIGLGTVFFLQSLVALHEYLPEYFPRMFLRYNLTNLMSEEPWVYFSGLVKTNMVYFTFIGVAYFIRSKVTFSLWSIFLIRQVFNVNQRMVQYEVSPAAWQDQHFGACVAFFIAVIWIGRHHWWMVLRQTVRGVAPGEPRGDYLSYRAAALIVVVSMLVMGGWLTVVGVQPWVSAILIGMIVMAHLVTTRIVAETGLPFIRTNINSSQIYTNLPVGALTSRDVFFSGVFTINGAYTTRESLMGFSLHGLQVHRRTDPPAGERGKMLGLMAWALVLGFAVSAMSSLWCYYRYATPIAADSSSVLNPHLLETLPRHELVDPLIRHSEGRFPPKTHNPWLHFGIGAAIIGLLQTAALRWSGWPFMPIGYLICMYWYIEMIWFSLLLGWLAKVTIMRYGGASLYLRGRPLFIGLIFGEALAAAFWLIVSLLLALNGHAYKTINFMPT